MNRFSRAWLTLAGLALIALPVHAAEVARLVVAPASTEVSFQKKGSSMVATLPAGTRFRVVPETFDYQMTYAGGGIVLTLTLPAGAMQFGSEVAADAVSFFWSTDGAAPLPIPTSVTVVTAPVPTPAPTPTPSPGPIPNLPIPGAVMEKFTDVLPTEEVNFDPMKRLDFALPASPASVAIASDAEVLRPATPQLVGTEILSHFDQDNRLASGFALSFAPYLLLNDVPIRTYRDDPQAQFLSRLQVSVAAKPGVKIDGQDATLFSLGFSAVIFDRGDPRLDEQLDRDFTGIFPANELPVYTGTPLGEIAKGKIDKWSKSVDASRARNWNKDSLGLGYAPRWLSRTGKVSDVEADGGMFWGALSLQGPGKLKATTQFLANVQYRLKDRFPDPADSTKFLTGDAFSGGVQLRFGSPNFNGFAEASYSRYAMNTGPKRSAWSYEVGVEKRISEGLWLQAGLSNSSPEAGKTETQVKSGVRYGFGQGPKLELK